MTRRIFALRTALLTILAPLTAPASFAGEDRERARQHIGIRREQQRQIEALYKATDEQRGKLRKRLHDLYAQLDAVFDAYDFDRSRAGAIGAETMEIRRGIMQLQFDNEEKLRRILSREQFERLRAELEARKAPRQEPGPRGDRERRLHKERRDETAPG